MRRINRHRRQQRLDPLRVEIFDVLARLRAQLFQAEHANGFFRERRNEFRRSSIRIVGSRIREFSRRVLRAHLPEAAVGSRLALSMLHLLQQAGDAHFHELVQVARRNREEFHALEQGIARVVRFFQNSLG